MVLALSGCFENICVASSATATEYGFPTRMVGDKRGNIVDLVIEYEPAVRAH